MCYYYVVLFKTLFSAIYLFIHFLFFIFLFKVGNLELISLFNIKLKFFVIALTTSKVRFFTLKFIMFLFFQVFFHCYLHPDNWRLQMRSPRSIWIFGKLSYYKSFRRVTLNFEYWILKIIMFNADWLTYNLVRI